MRARRRHFYLCALLVLQSWVASSFASFALLASWLVPLCAAAEEAPRWTLNWVRAEGAESCVSGRELELKLGQALAEAKVASAPRVIEGLIMRDAESGQFRVRLRVLDEREAPVGLRELSSSAATCDTLTPSIILVLSMLVELSSGRPEPERAPAPSTPVAPESVQAPAPVEAHELPPALLPERRSKAALSTPHTAIDVDAALALAPGLTPDLSVGPMLGLRVRTPWLIAFSLRAGYWPAGRTRIVSADARSAAVDFQAFETDLALCLPLPRNAAWWIAGCWGAAFLVRKAHVVGLESAPDSLRFTAGAHAALQVGYAVTSHLLLSFEASLLGFRRRDSYTYDDPHGNVRQVFRPGHFAGIFGMSLGVRL